MINNAVLHERFIVVSDLKSNRRFNYKLVKELIDF